MFSKWLGKPLDNGQRRVLEFPDIGRRDDDGSPRNVSGRVPARSNELLGEFSTTLHLANVVQFIGSLIPLVSTVEKV